jgi:hypothetical protein
MLLRRSSRLSQVRQQKISPESGPMATLMHIPMIVRLSYTPNLAPKRGDAHH